MEVINKIQKKSTALKISKKSLSSFKNLNLIKIIDTNTYKSFMDFIELSNVILATKNLLSEYYDNVDLDMIHDILMAYCISSYPNEIFDIYCSRSEKKLMFYANKVVVLIERLLDNINKINELNKDIKFMDEFYKVIDHYCSLYRTWKTKDILNDQTNIFEELLESMNLYKLQSKISMKNNLENKIIAILEKLFQNDPNYAIQMLLFNYNKIKDLASITNVIWEKIYKIMLSNMDMIFLILVVELRIKIIPLLEHPNDRRDVYYGIDTEEIINDIRNNDLNIDQIQNTVNKLQNKVIKINEKYLYQTILFNDNDKENCRQIIYVFKNMFNSI